MGPEGMIFIFWMLNFKPPFSTLLFHFQEALQFLFGFYHKGDVICTSEVIDISSGNLDFSLCFIHISIFMMYSAYKLNKQYTSLMYSFPNLEPVLCSMSGSNLCFLTCIQFSQEAGNVIWSSHLFKNFPQFVVIHKVKGFGVVNKAEVDVFFGTLLLFVWSNGCWQFDLWFLCLF